MEEPEVVGKEEGAAPAMSSSTCGTGSFMFPGAICRANVARRSMPAAQAGSKLR